MQLLAGPSGGSLARAIGRRSQSVDRGRCVIRRCTVDACQSRLKDTKNFGSAKLKMCRHSRRGASSLRTAACSWVSQRTAFALTCMDQFAAERMNLNVNFSCMDDSEVRRAVSAAVAHVARAYMHACYATKHNSCTPTCFVYVTQPTPKIIPSAANW